MKKLSQIFSLFAAVAMLFMVVSCQKEELLSSDPNGTGNSKVEVSTSLGTTDGEFVEITDVSPLDVDIAVDDEFVEITNFIPLYADPVIMNAFSLKLSSVGLGVEFSDLGTNESELYTYSNGVQTVFTPIYGQEGSSQLVSFYDPATQDFDQAILQIIPSDGSSDESFSGRIVTRNLAGSILYDGIFANDQLVNLIDNSGSGKDWQCIAKCLIKLYTSNLGKWCKKKCQSCFSSPGWLNCGICGGCIIGGVAYCWAKC